jgi:hypothetical protein
MTEKGQSFTILPWRSKGICYRPMERHFVLKRGARPQVSAKTGRKAFRAICTSSLPCSDDNDQLSIQYYAISDKKTVLSMTNHAYFNLAGHNAGKDALLNHQVKMNAVLRGALVRVRSYRKTCNRDERSAYDACSSRSGQASSMRKTFRNFSTCLDSITAWCLTGMTATPFARF